jgi:hypothetical protein
LNDEPAQQIDLPQGLDAPVPPEPIEPPQAPAADFPDVDPAPAENEGLQGFRFLTDHNVPVSLGNALIAMGHDVVKVSDVMPADSPDPVVARAAIEDARILISWDRDFNAQRLASPRFAELSRIMMSGPEPEGADRITSVFDVVEFALRRNPGVPIIIRIGVGKVQIHV